MTGTFYCHQLVIMLQNDDSGSMINKCFCTLQFYI